MASTTTIRRRLLSSTAFWCGLGAVAAIAAVTAGAPAVAGPDACATAGTVATCQGDQSEGITNQGDGDFTTPPVQTLTVDGLTADIAPANDTPGIEFVNEDDNGIAIDVDLGAFSIETTGTGLEDGQGEGIRAVDSGDGGITIDFVGTIVTDDDDSQGIVARDGEAGDIVIRSEGDITTRGDVSGPFTADNATAIDAVQVIRDPGGSGETPSPGSISITSRGDLTTFGESADGIGAVTSGERASIVIDSVGDIDVSGIGAHGISAENTRTFQEDGSRNTGNITVTSVGDITTRGGLLGPNREPEGIYVLNEAVGDVLVRSTGTIRIEGSPDNDASRNGEEGEGIRASGVGGLLSDGDDGSVTVINRGDIFADGLGGEGIIVEYALSDQNDLIIDTIGDFDTRAVGIVALESGNAGVQITSVGDLQAGVRSTPSTTTVPIRVREFGFGNVAISSEGALTSGSTGRLSDETGGIDVRSNQVGGSVTEGGGDVTVTSRGAISTVGDSISGIYITNEAGDGTILVDQIGDITTTGEQGHGLLVENTGDHDTTIRIDGTISARGVDADGIRVSDVGAGSVTITTTGPIMTAHDGVVVFERGDGDVTVAPGGAITTDGNGIRIAEIGDGALLLDVTVDVTTAGDSARGVIASEFGAGDTTIGVSSAIVGSGANASGILVGGGDDRVGIVLEADGSISLSGDGGVGIGASGFNALDGSGSTVHATVDGTITTSGDGTIGVSLTDFQDGDLIVDHTGTIATGGAGAHGIWTFFQDSFGEGNTGDTTVTSEGTVTASGVDANGILVQGNAVGTHRVTVAGGVVTGGTGAGAGLSFAGASAGATGILDNQGTITAGSGTAVRGGDGDETVTNRGLLDGTVDLGAGRDTLNLPQTGTIDGDSTLGAGDDRLIYEDGFTTTGRISGGADTDAIVFAPAAGTTRVADIAAQPFDDFEVIAQTGPGTLELTGGALPNDFLLRADAGLTRALQDFPALSVAVGDGAVVQANTTLADVTIGTGGRFEGTATLSDLSVDGTVAPGASVGTLVVAGDATFAVGSVYDVEIAGDGTSDFLDVGGTATLDGGTVTVAALDPATSYVDGRTYTILDAGGGITGEFADAISRSAFLTPTLQYTPNTVVLAISLINGGGGDCTDTVVSAATGSPVSLPEGACLLVTETGAITPATGENGVDGAGDNEITVEDGGTITGDRNGVVAVGQPSSVETAGMIVGSAGDGVRLDGGGTVTVTETGRVRAAGVGIDITGTGTVGHAGTITTTGDGGHGIAIMGRVGGLSVAAGGGIATTGTDADGLFVQATGDPQAAITVAGTIETAGADADGIHVTFGPDVTDDLVLTTEAGSSVSSTGDSAFGIELVNDGTGDTQVDIGGTVSSTGAVGLEVDAGETAGSVTVRTRVGSTVSGEGGIGVDAGIDLVHRGTGDVTVDIQGDVTGQDALNVDSFGTAAETAITVGGTLTASSDEGIDASTGGGSGALTVTTLADSTVRGRLNGIDLRHGGTGALTLTVGGRVTGEQDEAIFVGNFGDGPRSIVEIQAGATVEALGEPGIVGEPGIAVSGAADVTVAGTVAGSEGGAILFDLGAAAEDRLALQPGFSITGDVLAGPGTDVFVLGGVGSQAFDIGLVDGDGDADPGEQYVGFERFVKDDASTWTLTGSNGEIADFAVTDGTLLVTASMPDTAFTVTGGMLGGAGTVAGITVDAGATVAPGTSIGTLTTTGDVTFAVGSTYRVEIAGDGTADRLDVGGSATLQGGTVQVIALDPATSYTDGQTYRIVQTRDGVTGRFDRAVSDAAFIDPTLRYDDADAVDLVINPVDDPGGPGGPGLFPMVAETPNQAAAATGLDDLDQTAGSDALAVFNRILMLSAPEARAAFDAASGEVHASAQHVTGLSFDLFARTLRQRGPAGLDTGLPGAQVAQFAAVPAAVDDGLLASLGPNERPGPGDAVVWVAPMGGTGSIDDNGNAGDLDWFTAGVAGGYERGFDLSRGDLVAGLSFGYLRSGGSVDDRRSELDANTFQIGGYAAWQDGPWLLSGALAYGASMIETERQVAIGALTRTAEADYLAHTVGVSGEAAYRVDLGGVTVAPLVTLDAGWTFSGDDTETGAGALNLAIEDEGQGRFDTGIGVAVGHDIPLDDGTLSLEVRGVFEHAFADTTPERSLSLAGSPTGFTVDGAEGAENRGRVGAALTYRGDGPLSVSARYDGVFSTQQRSHTGSVTLGLRF